MSVLDSLISDVYTLTNRPDLVGQTALAVRAATLKAHQFDDWYRDFSEYSIQFSNSDYYQTLDYKSIFPNWRKPKYVRKYDATGSSPGPFLEYLVPEKVVDNYGSDRLDIFYMAGANLQLRSSTQVQYLLLGIYENPVVTPNGYNSWIAVDFPFAITYEAAAVIFKAIGLDENVPAFRQMVADQYQLLKQHCSVGLGY
jgi:hypothetical protein